jgi:hypothetical protein
MLLFTNPESCTYLSIGTRVQADAKPIQNRCISNANFFKATQIDEHRCKSMQTNASRCKTNAQQWDKWLEPGYGDFLRVDVP